MKAGKVDTSPGPVILTCLPAGDDLGGIFVHSTFHTPAGRFPMPRQTTFMKPNQVTREWRHVDASGKVLGRLASRIAVLLMGKHRPEYTPHVDTGDFVIVTNASKVVLTGNKADQKVKTRYSGYPGGLKVDPYRRILERHPERIVEDAVRRMLPKSPLGRDMVKKLKVYAGPEHPHTSQQPVEME